MDSRIEEKINEILAEELCENTVILSAGEISDFEEQYKVCIHPEYKEFLVSCNAGYVKDNWYFPMMEKSSITNEDGLEQIMLFYNREFVSGAASFIEIWGDKVLPIGESLGGDYVCIGVQSANLGKIFLLYHEDEERSDCLYLVSNSFNEFILSFIYDEF